MQRRALLRRAGAIAAILLLPTARAADALAAVFQPGVYRGKLGERDIQMELTLDPETPESLLGRYFILGDGAMIQIAGEFEGSDLYLEESHDGIEVSGTWNGKLDALHLTGTWTDATETQHLMFSLQRVAALTARQAALLIKQN